MDRIGAFIFAKLEYSGVVGVIVDRSNVTLDCGLVVEDRER
jgi:hypothetical protein